MLVRRKDDDEDEILEDGQRMRVPFMLMDSLQQSVFERHRKPAAIEDGQNWLADRAAAHEAKMRDYAVHGAAMAHRHRPGAHIDSKVEGIRHAARLAHICNTADAWRGRESPPVLHDAQQTPNQAYEAYRQSLGDAWR